MREYNIGDIAHMSNNRRVCGDYNLQSTCDEDAKYKRFIIKMDEPVEIASYHTADPRIGYTYDVYYTDKDNNKCFIECIGQTDLYSKKGWATATEMKERIAELKAQLKEMGGADNAE